MVEESALNCQIGGQVAKNFILFHMDTSMKGFHARMKGLQQFSNRSITSYL